MVGGAVGEQGVQSVRLVGAVGVHGQLLPESFLFPAVCKPVVDTDLSDQVGPQAMGFGGGDTSLQTFCPENEQKGDGEQRQSGGGWPGLAPNTQSRCSWGGV